MKNFDQWNEVKKNLHRKEKIASFKEREIYWTNIGENVGFEQAGKGDDFTRPVLILKKFTKNMFFGIPLSTKSKSGSFFFEFNFLGDKPSTALLMQARMFDVKRLDKRMGMIHKDDFENLKKAFGDLVGLEVLPSANKGASPEGNCNNNYTINSTNDASSKNV